MPFDPLKGAAAFANNAAEAARGFADQAGAAAQAAGATVQSAAKDLTDKATQAASQGTQALQDTASKAQHDIDIWRYNPLFPAEYHEPDFHRPKLVVLADPSPRKDIEACNGSIGWTSKEGPLEVLHLYDSAVPESSLTFYPSPALYGIYYEDPLEPSKYISISKFFDVVQQDQMSELHDIAYALGAKHCRLEIIEEEKTAVTVDAKVEAKPNLPAIKKQADEKKNEAVGELNGNIDPGLRYEKNALRKVQFDEVFIGDAEPRQPDLHWYANDKTIRSLIDKRLGNGNKLVKYSLLLDYKTSDFIDAGMAGAIDAALKQMRVMTNFSIEGEYKKEARTKMELLIEF